MSVFDYKMQMILIQTRYLATPMGGFLALWHTILHYHLIPVSVTKPAKKVLKEIAGTII